MNKIIEELFVKTINSNLMELFNELEEKYGETCGFTKEMLYSKYKVLDITQIREYKRKVSVVKPIEINLEEKCNARIWGGNVPRVVFNELTDKWEYGLQCSKKKKEGEKYCGIHLRRLPHGDITEEPPHRHFETHKKIDLKICCG